MTHVLKDRRGQQARTGGRSPEWRLGVVKVALVASTLPAAAALVHLGAPVAVVRTVVRTGEAVGKDLARPRHPLEVTGYRRDANPCRPAVKARRQTGSLRAHGPQLCLDLAESRLLVPHEP